MRKDIEKIIKNGWAYDSKNVTDQICSLIVEKLKPVAHHLMHEQDFYSADMVYEIIKEIKGKEEG